MEGGISSEKAPIDGGGFMDTLFSWSLDDIQNEVLFKDEVTKIPDTFLSVGQYCMSYVSPLLEETRAELSSSLETICQAPFAEVISLKHSSRRGESLYDIKVDYWRNRKSGQGKEAYKTLPGDILLLTDIKPETVSDLNRVGRTWTFASVKQITEDENDDGNSSTYFKLKMSSEVEFKDERQKSLFVVFLMNITTGRRIWNALHLRGEQSILKEVLCMDSMAGGSCINCSDQYNDIWCENLLMGLLSELNEPQREAVLGCIARILCGHKPGFELIWGPPGTGKTKTVSTLLLVLLRKKYRVLACAPTNIAVTEVAKRVLKLLKADSRNDVFCSSLGDILLFGNKERLKVDSDIEEIYLDYRVERLLECFGPLTGWWYCCTSMIDFLEDGFIQYQTFVENALIQQRDTSKENEMKKNECCSEVDYNREDKPKTFLIYARERFFATMSPLYRCLSILCRHISKSCLVEDSCQKILSLLQLLQSFETLLFQGDVTSQSLEMLFSQADFHSTSEDTTGTEHKLRLVKIQSIVLLKEIRSLLEGLNLPSAMNVDSVRKFCLQNSCLIFSTASSSFKLLSLEKNPLNVVVIDEAAQLKECESTIPLQLPGIRSAILIGDECQLPSTVISKVSEEAGFGRSLFQRLSILGQVKHLLSIQYRMHPSISRFPDQRFYHNAILDAPSVKKKSFELRYLLGPMFGPYSFINVFGREEREDVGCSLRNMVEVAVVVRIVRSLYKAWTGSSKALSIGVVSPYAAQVDEIQEKLGQKYDNCNGFKVKVRSVDGFQGGEEDVIIISTVRSNSAGNIGFLENCQRTNVALTRARHCLWIVGNGRTLCNSESVWDSIVCDAKDRGCFFHADEDKDLAKAILDVRKEFNQLDDLLDKNSELFRNEKWKVSFSDSFKRSFGKVPSVLRKKEILNLLLRLSSGWRPKKRNVDIICDKSSMILKQFKVGSCYVICSIDIIKNVYDKVYTQVLKAWDILPLEDIERLVKRLDGIFEMYADDFIKLCKEKCLEGDLEVPKTWPATFDIVKFKDVVTHESDKNTVLNASSDRYYAENSKVSESLLLMKFYSLSSAVVNHMLSDWDGRELELPFEVTDKEMEIILFQRSTFILGRSGTGKTTVLTTKLFKKEQQHQIANEGLGQGSCGTQRAGCSTDREMDFNRQRGQAILRQLFVTVSPRLCAALRNHILQLKRFADGGSYSAETSSADVEGFDGVTGFKDIPDSFVGIAPIKYPLVITFQKFLLMLDGTVGRSFFERFSGIPDLYKEIGNSTIALASFMKTGEVNYDKFCSVYWPHFNEKLTKRLDPSRVFTEIISHIKGGLRAGEFADGRITREKYVMLSEGRISTLSRHKREAIYDIFDSYERMKRDNGEFDLADLVVDLHNRLNCEMYGGDLMDFVYIDEVQDLTMRQIALFKHVCKNVSDGFVFAGDTAQTIARGIDFRFEDIRSLFYNEFVIEPKNRGSAGKKEKGQISKIFHLNQNFRTHDGVLRLAQSVIDLLYRFFPQFVDILSPETSLICGEAPTFLERVGEATAIKTIFSGSQDVGDTLVGFGAEQVILVRDDFAKKETLEYIGKQALVLTIVECKGLEFQDVLLLNFFGSSPMKNQWRIIYEFMYEQHLLNDHDKRSFPSFNEAKHNVLCSELKQLYVAVTRTKQRLWICEDSDDICKPMFDYWKSKSIVTMTKLDDSFTHAMRVASSPEEWKLKGYKLLHEGNYQMATMCFERAGDSMGEKLATAARLRADADRLHGSDLKSAANCRRQAAEIFDSIGKAEDAAECFYMLKEYERAGKIYLEKCGECALERAGECFLLARCYGTAADVFARGKLFSKCLSVCIKGKLFDIGLKYVHYWNQHADQNEIAQSGGLQKLKEEFVKNCALHYYENNDRRTMLKYVKAFESTATMRTFLKSLDCLDELLSLEEEWGNYLEAASIAKLRGDILLEADLLGKGCQFRYASDLIMWHVFASSLWSSGSKGWPLKQFPGKEELLMKAESFAKEHSDPFYDFICSEANMLCDDLGDLVWMKNHLYASQMHQSIRGEIVSARKILDHHIHLNVSKYAWEDEMAFDLGQYSEYQISCGQLSAETLVYFWNLWKDEILNIFEYFKLSGSDEVNKYRRYGEFCLNYFGVWMQNDGSNDNCILLIPDASWVREHENKVLQRNDKLLSINRLEFVAISRRFWCAEIISVGMKVLDKLQALHETSTRKSLSNFCQSRTLTHIYLVAKFLLTSKFQDSRQLERSLLKFIQLSTGHFFDYVFPCHWQETLTRSMILLRGNKVSTDVLEEYIHERIDSRSGLSYGEIGTVAMILLGSWKIKNELYVQIIEGLKWNPAWRNFMMTLKNQRVLEVSAFSAAAGSDTAMVHVNDPMTKVTDKESIIKVFFEALQDTYNANWRMKDYISPSCFIYLLERYVILLSSLNGFVYTTKSAFVEWLIFQDGMICDSSYPVVDPRFFQPQGILMFIQNIARQFLFGERERIEWVRKSHPNISKYNPPLVLRVVVIVCLLQLNFWHCPDLIFDVMSRGYITRVLPMEFYHALRRMRRRDAIGVRMNVIAEALNNVGNPLVFLKVGEKSPSLCCPSAIFVDMKISRSKEETLERLFPKIEAARPSRDAESPSSIKSKGSTPSSATASPGKQVLDVQNPSEDHGLTPPVIWEMFGNLKEADQSQMSIIFSSRKMDLEKYIQRLAAVTRELPLKEQSGDESELPFKKALKIMLDEMKMLYDLLDVSELKIESNVLKVKELCTQLCTRRPAIEPFLQQLFSQNAEPSPDESSSKLDKDGDNHDAGEDGQGKVEPSQLQAAGTSEPQSNDKETEQKATVKKKPNNKNKKGKPNNKNKKGKGGRKKNKG